MAETKEKQTDDQNNGQEEWKMEREEISQDEFTDSFLAYLMPRREEERLQY